METTLPLRPYQLEALEAIEAAHARGVQRMLVASPTGSGKTVLFAHLAARRRGRTLILAHRDELIQQAVDKLAMVDPTLELGVVKAESNAHEAPVVVASVQTLSRPKRLEQVTPDFETVIVDEAHHAWAETYQRVLEHFRCFHEEGPLTLGVTATPERGDHKSLGEVFQELVYEKKIVDLIPEYLCDLRAMQISLDCDFRELHTRHGDFIDGEVERMLLNADAPTQVAKAYAEFALGRKALVFTPTVKTAYAMVDAFRAEGDCTVEGLDGTTPLEERRDMLQRFHRGETMVLSNCSVLTEGYDEPSVNAIFLCRPTRSKVLYAQLIGRGCRHFPGKSDCLIVDTVGLTSRHDLMTFAGLFDIEEKRLEDQTLREALDGREVELAQREAMREQEGRLVASVVDLFHQRQVHWIDAGQQHFALSLGGGTMVFLRPMPELGEDRWAVVRKYQTEAGQTRREDLKQGLNLGYAQGFAEDYARKHGVKALVDRQARWRQDPPSEGQLRVLRKVGIPIHDGLTKGEASDLISAAAIYWG
jgi:ATP-dependent helicase IRC3